MEIYIYIYTYGKRERACIEYIYIEPYKGTNEPHREQPTLFTVTCSARWTFQCPDTFLIYSLYIFRYIYLQMSPTERPVTLSLHRNL